MRWACSIRSSTIRRRNLRRRGGGPWPRPGACRVAERRHGPGVLHGNRTYLLMNDDGQIQEVHSISAGLDYPGIGPEHSWLHETWPRHLFCRRPTTRRWKRFSCCSRLEGIIPALETAHAIAKLKDLAPKRPEGHLMVVNLSGRGDKDCRRSPNILEGTTI